MSRATRPTTVSSVPSSRTNPQLRWDGTAPLMARSFTVPFTARWPIEPPGKNSGWTTKVSVEKASRAPPREKTAESPCPAPGWLPKAGTKRCSTSSADSCPPPPWPITTVGLSLSGSGQVQPSKSRPCPPSVEMSDMRRLLQGEREAPVEGVRRARSLTGHHGRAERVPWRALLAESRAVVRLDQTLQHLAAAADVGLGRVDPAD